MKIPSKLRPPYQIGPNTYITTHRSRSADPAAELNLLQRALSHLPLKVRGPKPPAPTGSGGGEPAARPSSPLARRTGQLPPPAAAEGKDGDTGPRVKPDGEEPPVPEPSAAATPPRSESPTRSSAPASPVPPLPDPAPAPAEPKGKGKLPLADPAGKLLDPAPSVPPARPGSKSSSRSSSPAPGTPHLPTAEAKGKGRRVEPHWDNSDDERWTYAPFATRSLATASRTRRLSAAEPGDERPPVAFLAAQMLPVELCLKIVDLLDVASLRALRLVNRAVSGMSSMIMPYLDVRSGADIPQALERFPAALTLTATWDSTADAKAADAIRSARKLHAVSLGACDSDKFGDANVATIAQSASIKVLFVPGNHITWKGVQAVVDEGRIEALDLSHNPITSMFDSRHMSARSLGASQVIRGLAVASCELNDDDAAHLAASKSIVKLVASHNRFGPDAAFAFAANGAGDPGSAQDDTLDDGTPARVIEEIDLSSNPLGSLGIRNLATTRTIRSMTLANTGAHDDLIVDADMGHLARCASLTMVDVSRNWLGPDAARHASTSQSLEELHMSGNPIGDTGAGHLAGRTGLPRIRILALDDCAIGDLGALALADKPGLQELSLKSTPGVNHPNTVSGPGARVLMASPSLRKLDLSGCNVGSRDVDRLVVGASLEDLTLASTQVDSRWAAALATAPALHRLDMSANPAVDDTGGTALAASETLQEANLSHTGVGDETAIAMARNPVIRKLDLSGCPNITEKGRAALEAQRHRFEELRL